MASAVSQTDDYECSICLDIYDQPEILNCGHSLCAGCIKDYIKNRRKFSVLHYIFMYATVSPGCNKRYGNFTIYGYVQYIWGFILSSLG